MDWREFVETMSVVDRVLREDPGEPTAGWISPPATATATLSRRSRRGAVCTKPMWRAKAILLASEARPGTDGRSRGTCRVLPDRQGIAADGTSGGGAPAPSRDPSAEDRSVFPAPLSGLDHAVDGHFFRGLAGEGACRRAADWLLALFGALSLLCASRLAVALVNWLATLLVKPHPLPRMDFSEGIPPESRALVVIPTMLTSARNIEDLVESLEVRFLANRDDNLHFGLLTDFRDANEETIPEDGHLLPLARKGIEALNDKYGNAKSDPFFLFHRPRRWNPRERTWMGYERKRGKLAELNLLLRGGGAGSLFASSSARRRIYRTSNS